MKKSFLWISIVLCSVMCLAAPRSLAETAQKDASARKPTARDVIDKFVIAIGGREQLDKRASQHASGKFEVESLGLSGKMEIWALKPDKLLVRIDIPGFGLIENGYDGESGWSIDPAAGPKLFSGKELEQLRYEADFYAPLHEEKNYKSIELTETTVFEGKECHKLKCVRLSGDEVFEYYDTRSGLLHATEMNQATPLGIMKTTSIANEYKTFGGLKIAAKSTQKTMGVSQTIQVNSVDFDPIPEKTFAVPAKIQALKNKKP